MLQGKTAEPCSSVSSTATRGAFFLAMSDDTLTFSTAAGDVVLDGARLAVAVDDTALVALASLSARVSRAVPMVGVALPLAVFLAGVP